MTQKKVTVTVSCGAAQLNQETDIDQLLKLADDRLYVAKQNGRDQLVYADVKPISKLG